MSHHKALPNDLEEEEKKAFAYCVVAFEEVLLAKVMTLNMAVSKRILTAIKVCSEKGWNNRKKAEIFLR
jgi:hypothetical protein